MSTISKGMTSPSRKLLSLGGTEDALNTEADILSAPPSKFRTKFVDKKVIEMHKSRFEKMKIKKDAEEKR